MAEGDITIYNNFKEQLMLATMDMDSHSFKIILMTGYTPDIDADQAYADVSADEYGTGSGYTANDATLDNVSVTQDDANDRALWDADNETWASLGALTPATPSHAVIFNDDHASDALVCYVELGSTATNGGNYTIQWSAAPSAIISLT